MHHFSSVKYLADPSDLHLEMLILDTRTRPQIHIYIHCQRLANPGYEGESVSGGISFEDAHGRCCLKIFPMILAAAQTCTHTTQKQAVL